jgi:hypothetical protein
MKSALLECELTKRPQNVVWKDKNGQIIQDSDKYEIMNNGKLQGKQTNIYIFTENTRSYKNRMGDLFHVVTVLQR